MNDVLAITDANGDIVGNYEYDAWGKVLNADTDIAKQNPLRYRGYYYDNETGYYYLQSRYYDSNICRFINADLPEYSNVQKNICVGVNSYAYCCNEPINNNDSYGNVSKHLVGWGIQIDLSAGFAICSAAVGLELIWFKDKYHKGKSYAPYVYFYTSIGLGASSHSNSSLFNKAKSFVNQKSKTLLNKSPQSVSGIRGIFSFSLSISLFVIYGFGKTKGNYTKFTSASSYKGPFSTHSATAFGFKGYVATSSTCFVLGIGLDTNKFSYYYSNNYYYLLNKSESDLKRLFREIKKKAK